MKHNYDNLTALIIPTGIGASIGGYAGDAGFIARKFARKVPLIVNPNVVNAACFSSISENMLYVEGWAFSQFIKENLYLKPSFPNKIGIIFDKAITQEILNVHINTINAMKVVYGLDIIGYELTPQEVGVEFYEENNVSTGKIKNPQTLLYTGQNLLNQGANVLCVVTKFFEPQNDYAYKNGSGIDIVGGIEAIISHFISKNLFVPCAHAPAFDDISISTDLVNPKSAAEYITPTFLPCVLLGLNQAPQLTLENSPSTLSNKNLKNLIMPFNSLGSSIVFDAIKNNINLYAVKENKSVLNINPDAINLKNVIIKETYEELLGIL